MNIPPRALAACAIFLSACASIRPGSATPEPKHTPSPVVNTPTQIPVSPASSASQTVPKAAAERVPQQVFPGVRLAPGVVLVDGKAAADTAAFASKVVYLEVIACRPDSREHESLVVVEAMPSHLHAALLLAGATSGKPGSWHVRGNELVPEPPTGDRLSVSLRWSNTAGETIEHPVADLVKSTRGDALGTATDGFVFAGSGFIKQQGSERYAADVSGTLVGLCTFGDEPIAWSRIISPEAEIEEPKWTADGSKLPPPGTPVVLVIRLGPG